MVGIALADKNSSLDNCKNMIYKLAMDRWFRMKKNRPEVEFDDVLSEAYLIYAWCLQNYDNSKNTKFTTYLYMQLRGRLCDYYNFTFSYMDLYENYAIKSDSFDDNSYEDLIVSGNYELDEETEDLYVLAKEELSFEANEVLGYILSRDWENSQRHCGPSIGQICKKFGYPRQVVESVMGEIGAFWRKRPTLRSEEFFYNENRKSDVKSTKIANKGKDTKPVRSSALF